MARISSSNSSSSSSNLHDSYYYYNTNSNVRATCYAVNSSSAAIQGFHYSTTGAGGGMPSPPLSPPLAASHTSTTKHAVSGQPSRSGRARRGGAAYHITEECERLFCETLRTVFLGEGDMARQDSLVMSMHKQLPADVNDYGVQVQQFADQGTGLPSPPESDGPAVAKGSICDWIETWDYVGGIMFRGFVAENDGEKAMFVFFDQAVIWGDLKAGLMALLELCDVPYFSCSRLVVCVDRHTESRARIALTKDLGWIGFQLTTLGDFADGDEVTSDEWLFMDMEV
ncbi:hypothetical protein K491DRAFT_608600 [Lophiostoma macrostomum CBS 122681]|uniref:Ornithine decarboxylase antizyme n=1 Tax=Lophiostoma macrostomum CBS 122681 TaxID=1314788 RepID=A0A6A6SV86_9PLEO|nr:hypothetical protein K491DRAFT_608600 [Lophiostoma macrostomum CBS 122681]